jgi:hypothetical protein
MKKKTNEGPGPLDVWPPDPSHAVDVARLAVYPAVYGRHYFRDRCPAAEWPARLHRDWVRRLDVLRHANAGLLISGLPTFVSCVRCPTFDGRRGPKVPTCGRWFCPHCCGRRAADAYRRLAAASTRGRLVWSTSCVVGLGADVSATAAAGVRRLLARAPGRVAAGAVFRYPVVGAVAGGATSSLRLAVVALVDPPAPPTAPRGRGRRPTPRPAGGVVPTTRTLGRAVANAGAFPAWLIWGAKEAAADGPRRLLRVPHLRPPGRGPRPPPAGRPRPAARPRRPRPGGRRP